jgi:PHD/YefM family antitoxin component YafN of YafNO toxin-antitoxin module
MGIARSADQPCRAEPVTVAKDGRPVVVVLAVEEYERLKALDAPTTAPVRVKKAKG